MIEYTVADMTCGKCIKHITEVLNQWDPELEIDTDLDSHRLSIISEKSEALIKEKLTAAGYTPVLIES